MPNVIELGVHKNLVEVAAITGVQAGVIDNLMAQGVLPNIKPNLWTQVGINQVLLAKGLAQKKIGDLDVIGRLVKALPKALRGKSLKDPLAIWVGVSQKGEQTHFGLWVSPYGNVFDGEAYPHITSYVTFKAWGYGGAM